MPKRRDSSHSYPRRCPVCRSSMIGERRDPANTEDDHFNCTSCGTIIDLRGGDHRSGRGSEPPDRSRR